MKVRIGSEKQHKRDPETDEWKEVASRNGILFHEQIRWRHSDDVTEIEIPNKFYAVLQIHTTHRLRAGRLWEWKVITSPDLDFKIEYLPMNESALQAVIFGSEWVGVGLVDGKWGIKKHGGYVSIYPILASAQVG